MKIELIYEKTCPNINAAREQLLKALYKADMVLHWNEWEISDNETPDYARNYGSPTILVNGIDVAGEKPVENAICCRLYTDENGFSSGSPNLNDIVNVLSDKINQSQDVQRWQLNTSILPVIGVAFLPKLACPACWPAYAGLLSLFGIGIIDYTPYLLPLTLFFLFSALGALFYKAENRHGYLPFYIGIISSTILMAGKFYFENEFSMYIGLGLLILASIWNTWPLKSHKGDINCSACTTTPEN